MLKLIDKFFAITNPFFQYSFGIVIVYLAQVFFKLSKAWSDKSFDWRKLLDGTVSYALYFIGVILLFFAGEFVPDMKFTFLGNTLTLQAGLTLLALCLFAAQVKKAIQNIIETFKITDNNVKELKTQLNDYDVDKFFGK